MSCNAKASIALRSGSCRQGQFSPPSCFLHVPMCRHSRTPPPCFANFPKGRLLMLVTYVTLRAQHGMVAQHSTHTLHSNQTGWSPHQVWEVSTNFPSTNVQGCTAAEDKCNQHRSTPSSALATATVGSWGGIMCAHFRVI